jgi:hypothetical protein
VAAGVVKNTTLTNNTASGTWTSSDATQPLTDNLLRELIKGRLYLNAHTSSNPGGEIRGQVVGSPGVATSVEQISAAGVPSDFRLNQNYPNPFNPTTTITFEISKVAQVSLKIYNVLGQVVSTLVDGVKQPGFYTLWFNAAPLNSGVYFYSLATDGAVAQTKKMVLLK